MNNEALVAELVRSKALKTPSIIEAFLNVDRKDFVLDEHKDFAYEDKPLPLISNSTISQPTTVALMLEWLQPQANQKILDLGSGSGWTTALLAECVGKKGKIIAIEVYPELVELGQKNLKKYNYKQVVVTKADKNILGLPKEAPFDGILVSAAASAFPHDLSDQLKIGGKMIIPINHSIFKVIRISDTEVEASEFPGFSFVPLTT